MKSKLLYFHYITLFIFCQALAVLIPFSSASALTYQSYDADYETGVEAEYVERFASHNLDYVSYNTSDFYFSDFTADYYLEKAGDGTSHLRVKETVTAEFPPYKQNKGLTRKIPYTNQGGKNLTLDSLNTSNIKITRNGLPEPIYDIEKDDTEQVYYLSIGTNEYVTGTQVYTFEYAFDHVVTDFSDFQELYWDTNGTDSYQPFQKVTAIVHLEDEAYQNILTSKTSCYVGINNSSDGSRCKISNDQALKTITFSAENLKAGENLTFAIDFQPNIFVVPTRPIDPFAVVVVLAQTTSLCICAFIYYRTRKKHQPTIDASKNIFVKPEYQPLKNLTVAEASAISIAASSGSKAMVATVTELAIKGKVKLRRNSEKSFGKYKWSLEIGDVSDLLPHEIAVLQMLVGEKSSAAQLSNQTFNVVKNYTNTTPYTTFITSINKRTRASGYMHKKSVTIYSPILIQFMLSFFLLSASAALNTYTVPSPAMTVVFVLISSFFIIVANATFINKYQAICQRTVNGIKLSKYYDGLKLYIKMAEAERIKFLQSVEGVDTNDKGIVKLYEKLLPYAIIFGLEKSWLKQLEHYYTKAGVKPTWYTGDSLILSDFSRDFSSFSSISSSSFAASMPSTGGSGSSGSSGGGGGGSSGGGGGGGGFGGR